MQATHKVFQDLLPSIRLPNCCLTCVGSCAALNSLWGIFNGFMLPYPNVRPLPLSDVAVPVNVQPCLLLLICCEIG